MDRAGRRRKTKRENIDGAVLTGRSRKSIFQGDRGVVLKKEEKCVKRPEGGSKQRSRNRATNIGLKRPSPWFVSKKRMGKHLMDLKQANKTTGQRVREAEKGGVSKE